jgi:hypothetical protein
MNQIYELYGALPEDPKGLPGQNNVIVDLAIGQVVIVGDFNLFRIDKTDRALIDELLAAVEKHREAKPEISGPKFGHPYKSALYAEVKE